MRQRKHRERKHETFEDTFSALVTFDPEKLPDNVRPAYDALHDGLQKLHKLTGWSVDEVRAELGCKREIHKIEQWDPKEVELSRSFLAYVTDLCQTVGGPPDLVRTTLVGAVQIFKASGRNIDAVLAAFDHDLGDGSAKTLLAEGHLGAGFGTAWAYPDLYRQASAARGPKSDIERELDELDRAGRNWLASLS
jgi:hypothetical protein